MTTSRASGKWFTFSHRFRQHANVVHSTATGSTAVPAAPPEYTQFYLANMYVWKKKGVKRVLDFLKKWNVVSGYCLVCPFRLMVPECSARLTLLKGLCSLPF